MSAPSAVTDEPIPDPGGHVACLLPPTRSTPPCRLRSLESRGIGRGGIAPGLRHCPSIKRNSSRRATGRPGDGGPPRAPAADGRTRGRRHAADDRRIRAQLGHPHLGREGDPPVHPVGDRVRRTARASGPRRRRGSRAQGRPPRTRRSRPVRRGRGRRPPHGRPTAPPRRRRRRSSAGRATDRATATSGSLCAR